MLAIPQLSVAVGRLHDTDGKHDPSSGTVMFVGQDVNVGLVLSATTTLKAQVLVFPKSSAAVYITCVVPAGKAVPDA
jgi:hypothetical protein